MSKVDDVERVARQHGEATFRLALSRAVVATTEKDHNGDIIETELELEDRVRVLLDKWCSNVVLAKQAERIARIEELCEQLRRMWV